MLFAFAAPLSSTVTMNTPHRSILQDRTNTTSSPFDLLPSKIKRKQAKRYRSSSCLCSDPTNPQIEPYPSEAPTLSASSELSEPVDEEPLQVETTDQVLLFGRKTASPLILAQYNADQFVPLKGKNASRVSAVVRDGTIEVLGLNGLMLNGVKMEKGQKAMLEARAELDFFGSKVILTKIRAKVEVQRDVMPQEPIQLKTPEAEEPIQSAPEVDIEGLLISSIVFASRSTVPMSEILPSLPPSVAQLPEDTLLDSLRNGPFGVIENPALKVRFHPFLLSLLIQQCRTPPGNNSNRISTTSPLQILIERGRKA